MCIGCSTACAACAGIRQAIHAASAALRVASAALRVANTSNLLRALVPTAPLRQLRLRDALMLHCGNMARTRPASLLHAVTVRVIMQSRSLRNAPRLLLGDPRGF